QGMRRRRISARDTGNRDTRAHMARRDAAHLTGPKARAGDANRRAVRRAVGERPADTADRRSGDEARGDNSAHVYGPEVGVGEAIHRAIRSAGRRWRRRASARAVLRALVEETGSVVKFLPEANLGWRLRNDGPIDFAGREEDADLLRRSILI